MLYECKMFYIYLYINIFKNLGKLSKYMYFNNIYIVKIYYIGLMNDTITYKY